MLVAFFYYSNRLFEVALISFDYLELLVHPILKGVANNVRRTRKVRCR